VFGKPLPNSESSTHESRITCPERTEHHEWVMNSENDKMPSRRFKKAAVQHPSVETARRLFEESRETIKRSQMLIRQSRQLLRQLEELQHLWKN
jgi:hypothetical protein